MYKFIVKRIESSASNPEALNWKGLKTFNVGRPKGHGNYPFKRAIAAAMAFAYLVFGFLLYVGVKIFSSKRSAYSFATVVFKWPRMFAPLIRALRSGQLGK